MFCRECGNENSNSARFCGRCGTKIEQYKQTPSRKWLFSGLLVSLICIAGISYLYTQVWKENELQLVEKNNSTEQKELLFTEPEKMNLLSKYL